MDPDGKATHVRSVGDGTYRVVGGLIDGDKSIYILDDNNAPSGRLGESLTQYSFFNENGHVVTDAIIDINDHSGEDFLNDEVINANPDLVKYMWNATSGKHYDFKERGIDKRPGGMSEAQYRYRGMPLSGVKMVGKSTSDNKTIIYGSARDVGNLAAGYIAGINGLLWQEARLGFDGLESWQHLKDNFPTWPSWKTEGQPTQQAQRIGWKNGWSVYWMNKK